jgi:DNA-binding NarL/FixJ family response regulator
MLFWSMAHTSDPTADSPTELQGSRWVGRATVAMVGFLGVASFALSYEALRSLAIETGALSPSAAWLLPILVDGAAIIFSLSAFQASARGAEKDRRWFFSLVVVITLVSVAFNVAHAQRGVVPAAIASLPPILLFAAFESLLRQFRPQTAPKRPAARPKRFEVQRDAKEMPSVEEPSERKARAIALAAEGRSNAAISRELGVSPATVSRYLRPK